MKHQILNTLEGFGPGDEAARQTEAAQETGAGEDELRLAMGGFGARMSKLWEELDQTPQDDSSRGFCEGAD